MTVDEYLEKCPQDARAALQGLRETIKSVVPGARERVSYGIPIIALDRDLVGFSSQKDHCSLHTMSPALVKTMEEELRGFKVSGATIHFQPDQPLPEALVKKIVQSRLDQTQKA